MRERGKDREKRKERWGKENYKEKERKKIGKEKRERDEI
jgi:hypothetical protein